MSSEHTNKAISIGPELFSFHSRQNWVNKGASWYRNSGHSKRCISIDAAGRVCLHGMDFMRAEKEGTYPITVYAIDAVELSPTGAPLEPGKAKA